MRWKCILTLFASLLPFFTLGQEIGERAVSLWNDGNSVICQTQVWDIVADTPDRDRVFCAGNDGLCIYAGGQWQNLRPGGNPIIRALKFDQGTGRLYSAGVNGYGYWLPDGYGSFTYTPLFINKEFRSFSLDFWRIALYMQKVLFQSREKIYVYDTALEKTDTLTAHTEFRYLYEADGRIWCQDGDSLVRFTPDFTREGICSIPGRIINLLPHDRGLVAVVERTGLLLLQDGVAPVPLDKETNRLLGEAKITCCEPGFSGGFLAGTTKSGMFVLDADGKIAETYPFSGNSILCLAMDRDGDIWAGFNNGVAMIDNSSPDRYIFDDRLGQVHCCAKWGESGILIGTNKGVFLRDGTGEIRPLEQFSGPTWRICVIMDQVYVLHDQGIFRLDPRGHAVPVSVAQGVYNLLPLPDVPGGYIAGTYAGLALYRLSDDGVLSLRNNIDGYRGFTRNMAIDEYGSIWVCVAGDGFVCLELDKDKTHVISKTDFNVAGPSEEVFTTTIDGELILVGGTKAFRPDAPGSLRRAEELDPLIGLCGPDATMILQDGNLFWYAGGSGAGFVERSGSSLSLHTGVLNKAGASRGTSGLLTMIDGAVYRGFRNGIGICRGARKKSEPLHVLSVTAVGARETLRYRLTDDVFEIPADMNTLRITLAGLSPERRLEYCISSLSSEWVSVQVDDDLWLNALPSGICHIKMRTPGETGTCSLTVRVRRPWYLQAPMLALYFVLFFGGVFAAIRIVQHQGRKKQEQLKRELDYLQMKNDLLEKERKLATRALIGVQADEEMERYFNEIYNGFTDRLKRQYPMLSKTDLKICIFVKMNLSGKEIANRMNISPKGVEVAKYRLRKKLLLPPGTTLSDFISSFDT